MPGVIAGTILSFILAMNAYATPVLLGGPTFQMMGPTVYNQFAGCPTGRSARRCLSC
jgi:putative spermidine/putrescine transport system permease protein